MFKFIKKYIFTLKFQIVPSFIQTCLTSTISYESFESCLQALLCPFSYNTSSYVQRFATKKNHTDHLHFDSIHLSI